ncbi:tRNA (cytosine34-C5)-methyltransferase [Nematocida homosporus]|uniref:tRNA (cytosine34-C5)-methyltransferase n=1 Tax=Nematocida homosporus TaxID=1912981 RepID=UPI00221E6743|nr:tRNA (cytosine34-C5)-methyltransferase [Nematocida homosporus]KAI5185966.1 tRNA (cytosine34-C5)-methyltransferase [Nematocida homosporus]
MQRESSGRKELRRKEGAERLLEYYTGILGECGAVIEKLKEPLPITFRVIPGPWGDIISAEAERNRLVRRLPWGERIYEVCLSRKDLTGKGIRTNQHSLDKDDLMQISQFLRTFCESSLITRQEAVSMIPVYALEIEPNSIVLDMCASPGSKSSQILESLGPDGVALCNDVNTRRVDQLIKQTKRFGHPGLLVSCNDATMYPHPGVVPNRVLCDVPCSGDGTLRKNPHIFETWSSKEALGLFKVQKKIIRRGFDLLAENGILVYSTCSLNPIENELVIMSLLAERPQAKIVPFDIEGLIARDGLSESAIRAAITLSAGDQEMQTLPYHPSIKNCRRVLPNDQNTGGFFITKIRKQPAPTTTTTTNSLANATTTLPTTTLPTTPQSPINPATASTTPIRGEKSIEESYLFMVDAAKREEIEGQWGAVDTNLVAKTDKYKNVYALNSVGMNIAQRAPGALRLVFAGTRVFSLFWKTKDNQEEGKWRMTCEGIAAIAPRTTRVFHTSYRNILSVLEADQELPEITNQFGLFLLVAKPSNPSSNPIVTVPVAIKGSHVEVLIEKIQRRTLTAALRLLLKYDGNQQDAAQVPAAAKTSI